MRFLKQKIQASFEASQKLTAQNPSQNLPKSRPSRSSRPQTQPKQTNSPSSEAKTRERLKGDTKTPKIYLQTKNIVTNFGKAIVTFAVSDIALPYLGPIIKKVDHEGAEALGVQDFIRFIGNTKANISSIDGFRALILEEETDEKKTVLCKKAFRMIAEVFIKYFSVNWITHGRVTYKMMHLKFRYKMLRRIQNPSQFTYLKGYNKKKENNKV